MPSPIPEIKGGGEPQLLTPVERARQATAEITDTLEYYQCALVAPANVKAGEPCSIIVTPKDKPKRLN